MNGNLLGDGQKSYAYDDFNQLSSVWVARQWKTDFAYDGLGRRRIARDSVWRGNWQQTNETRYLCDGLLPVQELNSNNAAQVTYTRGLDLSGTFGGAGGIGGLLARTDGSGTAIYHADLGGNITSLMDSGGNVVARYLYDPFGGLLGKWGPLADANRYRFSSKELHPASGLDHYGYRFFDSNLQRWINRDPIGEAGGIDLYGLAGNSPLNAVDAWGLRSWLGQWLYDLFYGKDYKSPSLDPNSLQALGNKAGFGRTTLYDEDGNVVPCGDRLANILADSAKTSVELGTMLTPLGEEEEGTELTGALGNKIKQALDKCRKKPGKSGLFKGTDALRASNKMARAAAKAEGLDAKQADTLHDLITGQDKTYQQILDLAKQVKNGLR